MAGWLRTFFLLFAAAHLLIIALNYQFGPFDPFANEGELTQQQVALGTGFYGVLMGLLTFGWLVIWLIIFLLLRNAAQKKR